MNQKILIILIAIVILSIGGFFVWKNISVPEKDRLFKNIPHTLINEICLKISQPDDTRYCLAVANKDVGFCDNLDEPEQKKLCQGMAARNISYCREIQEPGPKKMCYYELSFLTGEFYYCDEMENPNDCYFAFIHRLHWESRADEIKAEYCEKINDDTTEGKIFKNCCLSFREQNPSLCQENRFCLSFFKQPLSFCDTPFEAPEGFIKYKDDCLVDRALSEKNSNICAGIKEEELRDLCYGNFSTHISPDISLCGKIADPMRQNMCYAEYAFHLAQEESITQREPIIQEEPAEKTVDEKEVIEKESKPEGPKTDELTDQEQEAGEPEEEQPKTPLSYHIKDPPYYREDGFCWGASAIILMMYEGFLEDEIQVFRTILKSGPGGPPDMFRGFREFGVIDRVRIAYSKNYNKQFADFYNQQILVRPEEQVILLDNQTDALNRLRELISSDILVIIMGHHGNHYMVVTGYDEDYIYISDPGIDEVFLQKVDYQSEYQEKIKMSVENFFEQWNISDFEGGGIGFPGNYGMIWIEK